MNATKKTKTAQLETKPKKSARGTKAVTWTAAEHTPRKRWWWYALVVYFAILIVCLLLSLGNWTFALLVAVMTIAAIFAHASKPRAQRYTLQGARLQIANTSFDLTRFNRSINQEPWATSGEAGRSGSLLLLPKKRFGVPLSVFLPDDEKSATQVRAALTAQVPLDPNSSYRGALRVIDTLVKWTRL